MSKNKDRQGSSHQVKFFLTTVLIGAVLVLGFAAPVSAAGESGTAVGISRDCINVFDLSNVPPITPQVAGPQPLPPPVDVAMDRVGNRAAVSVQTPRVGTIYIVNPGTREATSYTLGSYALQQVAFNPAGDRLAIGNGNHLTNSILIVDPADPANTQQTLVIKRLGDATNGDMYYDIPVAVGYTYDGRYLLVGVREDNPTNGYTNYLNIYDAGSLALLDTRAIGSYPSALAVDPHDQYAVISSYGNTKVSIVDLTTFASSTVTLDSIPGEPSITADGRFALVPNGAKVSAIDLESCLVVRSISLAGWTSAESVAVIDEDTALVSGSGGVARIAGLLDLATSDPSITSVSTGAIQRIAVGPWAEPFVPTVNRNPTINPIGDQSVSEGGTLTFTVSGDDPDGGDTLTYSASNLPTGAAFDPDTQTFAWTPTFTQAGTHADVEFQVTDSGGLTDSETITITVTDVNRAPEQATIGAKTVVENQPLEFVVSATDPDGDTLTYSASTLPEGAVLDPNTGDFAWTPAFGQVGSYTVTFTVSDGKEGSDSEVVVIDVADGQTPVISGAGVDPNPAAIGVPVRISASVEDTTTGGSSIVSAGYKLNNQDWQTMDIVGEGASVEVSCVLQNLPVGLHSVNIKASDGAGNVAYLNEPLTVVVYDPKGGFVTGGGWITSSEKQNFSFNAKYKEGTTVPTGQMRFQLTNPSRDFVSTGFTWLVIDGPNAQFEGSGTIDGQGPYKFSATVTDSVNGDTFQVRIWNSDGFSSDTGPSVALGGGSIIVHA